MIFDARPCELGEGPLWHPVREQLFWFDILNRTLHSQSRSWTFADYVSAAGWISADELLVACETGLFRLNLSSGERSPVAKAGTPDTRSNDGRADRQGGFWFGTMGKRAQKGAGAIWRWYRGELRQLFPGITIPNAICFTPDGRAAHFADTATGKVMKVALDAAGWPVGEPEVWLDLERAGLNPDGAVIDAEGRFWNAQWGAGRVACYAPDGAFLSAIETPGAPQSSCPAFGGPDLSTLYVTTALEHMDAKARVRHPASGQLFAFPGAGKGLPEPQVTL
ncbi:SMP-30/gluconolactonase/LRE family protein [Tabrizicola thermarum]|uniref:SMP-30/gluconolactonase/LRE family protein n=1 Tax=Tabrizicola thermarum TaxID=2670345 RepID=UPI000FFC1B9D|nr:SMP-30/gluconolactonase/LRE family protein [Tabrizicola thermarum]